LKNLTDEEREIQNLFKNNKLEKWSKGLQKGLTQYVKETYDEERDALEKQALKERQLGRKSDVTDMNKDIYALDIDDQAQLVQEIDNEVNNLNEYLGENDDGELDGDEFY
jgi:flagellar biosynthesis/type III secretory pathway protein FliH